MCNAGQVDLNEPLPATILANKVKLRTWATKLQLIPGFQHYTLNMA